MSISEIAEEKDGDASPFIDTGAREERIKRILEHQKSLYWSSSSSSSSSASSSSSSSASSSSSLYSSRKSSSLLDLMKGGSTSLKRLFDMEHTSLAKYFEEYSGSPIIKPIPLWSSDSDYEPPDPWASIKQLGATHDPGIDAQSKLDSAGSFKDTEFGFKNRKVKPSNRRLRRKKSFKRLPGFGLWRCRGFRFGLKLRRLRILICGRIF